MKSCQSVDESLECDAVICDIVETTIKANLLFVESVEKLSSIDGGFKEELKEELCQRYSNMVIRVKEIVFEWIGGQFSDSGFCVDRTYFFEDLEYPEIIFVIKQKLNEILECVLNLKNNFNNKEQSIKQLLQKMG